MAVKKVGHKKPGSKSSTGYTSQNGLSCPSFTSAGEKLCGGPKELQWHGGFWVVALTAAKNKVGWEVRILPLGARTKQGKVRTVFLTVRSRGGKKTGDKKKKRTNLTTKKKTDFYIVGGNCLGLWPQSEGGQKEKWKKKKGVKEGRGFRTTKPGFREGLIKNGKAKWRRKVECKRSFPLKKNQEGLGKNQQTLSTQRH